MAGNPWKAPDTGFNPEPIRYPFGRCGQRGILMPHVGDHREHPLEEQEIKLRITRPERFETVAQAPEIANAAVGPPRTLAMQAIYIDTEGLDLLGAGYAYRVRWEGDHWVATVKADLGSAASDGLHRHSEWEATVATPEPDLEVFTDPELRSTLKQVRAGRPLVPLFQVTMDRHIRELALPQGSRVEWAADYGTIQADETTDPIREVELELKEGPLEPMQALAAQLQMHYPLEPDDRTKFARGLTLAGLQ